MLDYDSAVAIISYRLRYIRALILEVIPQFDLTFT